MIARCRMPDMCEQIRAIFRSIESSVAVQTIGGYFRLWFCAKFSIFCISPFTLLKQPRRIALWVITP